MAFALGAAVSAGLLRGAAANPSGSAASRLTIVPDGPILRPDAGPLTAVVPVDLEFDPKALTIAFQARLDPATRNPLDIAWSVSNTHARLGGNPDNPFTDVAAPRGGTLVTDDSYGKVTVSAKIGKPVALETTMPIFVYPSFAIGCKFRFAAAMNFDPDSKSSPSPDDDLYETGPVEPGRGADLNPCFGTPLATPVGSPFVLHTPYGATFVTDGVDPAHRAGDGTWAPEFPYIDTSYWRNSFTSVDTASLDTITDPCNRFEKGHVNCPKPARRVLLLKTRSGRIVKLAFLLATDIEMIGVYEVAGADGMFPY
jgi:hypothetical protein